MGRFIHPEQVIITSPLESNGAVPVNIQDQHSRALDLYFIKALATPTTLSAQADPGDLTIDVTSTTGFADGVRVVITTTGGDFFFATQIGAIAGSTVTVDTPIDITYASGSSCFPANKNMNVDGSVTTQVFQVGPVGAGTGVYVDITRIMGYIQDATAMDLSKFGGMVALTNGVVFRVNNTTIQNIWNVKTNGEIALLSYDAFIDSKAPGGSYGIRWRNTYAGQSKHGVTLRLAPGDKLELLIQDDLTDLEDFQVMAQGHLVTD